MSGTSEIKAVEMARVKAALPIAQQRPLTKEDNWFRDSLEARRERLLRAIDKSDITDPAKHSLEDFKKWIAIRREYLSSLKWTVEQDIEMILKDMRAM